jgi:hypothetical protein
METQTIVTQEQLDAIGPFSWPGGYANGFIGSEMAVLCFDCAKKSLGGNDPVLSPFCSANYDGPEYCDDCGKEIA